MLLDERLELADELGVARPRRARPRSVPRAPRAVAPRVARSPAARTARMRSRPAAAPRQSASASRSFAARSSGLGGRAGVVDERRKRSRSSCRAAIVERVAGRLRHEDSGAEHLPELRDEVLQRRARRARRVLAPERVDQPVDRHDASGLEQQEREHCALLQPAEEERARSPRTTSRGPRIRKSGM